MPKTRKNHISFLELAKQLLFGALGWSNDEMLLTKLDARALLRRLAFGLGLLLASFAFLIAAVFTLAETLIGALADYLHGNLLAGLIVSAGLFCITALIAYFAYAWITRKPVSKGVIFRKLLGDPKL
jgi:hypothetical protein